MVLPIHIEGFYVKLGVSFVVSYLTFLLFSHSTRTCGERIDLGFSI